MKLYLIFIFVPIISFGQTNPSDACTGVPSLPVTASCAPNTYNLPGAYANSALVVATCDPGLNRDDGWYSFVATNTTTIIDLTGDRNHTLAVWSSCGGGTELACSYAVAGAVASVNLTSVVGVTYYVQVHRNQSNDGSAMAGAICIHDYVAPSNNCPTAVQICSNSGFPGNSTGAGTQELSATNRGCLLSNEHQSSWYAVSIGTSGSLQFTISPANGTDDYDFGLWGPGGVCPPTATPIRCSYAAGGGNTGVNTGLNGAESPQTSEGSGGNRYVDDLAVIAGDVYYLCIDNYTSSLSPFTFTFGGSAGISCVPLPVMLVSFSCVPLSGVNLLTWVTKSEINNAYYTLESSIDGINWSFLAEKEGAGNSSVELKYEFRDYNLKSEVYLYRLWQTDYDGLKTDLGTVSADNSGQIVTLVKIINLLGEEVSEEYHGLKIYVFSDGSMLKRMTINQ